MPEDTEPKDIQAKETEEHSTNGETIPGYENLESDQQKLLDVFSKDNVFSVDMGALGKKASETLSADKVKEVISTIRSAYDEKMVELLEASGVSDSTESKSGTTGAETSHAQEGSQETDNQTNERSLNQETPHAEQAPTDNEDTYELLNTQMPTTSLSLMRNIHNYIYQEEGRSDVISKLIGQMQGQEIPSTPSPAHSTEAIQGLINSYGSQEAFMKALADASNEIGNENLPSGDKITNEFADQIGALYELSEEIKDNAGRGKEAAEAIDKEYDSFSEYMPIADHLMNNTTEQIKNDNPRALKLIGIMKLNRLPGEEDLDSLDVESWVEDMFTTYSSLSELETALHTQVNRRIDLQPRPGRSEEEHQKAVERKRDQYKQEGVAPILNAARDLYNARDELKKVMKSNPSDIIGAVDQSTESSNETPETAKESVQDEEVLSETYNDALYGDEMPTPGLEQEPESNESSEYTEKTIEALKGEEQTIKTGEKLVVTAATNCTFNVEPGAKLEITYGRDNTINLKNGADYEFTGVGKNNVINNI